MLGVRWSGAVRQTLNNTQTHTPTIQRPRAEESFWTAPIWVRDRPVFYYACEKPHGRRGERWERANESQYMY